MNKGCLWHSSHVFFFFLVVLGDHFFSVTAPSSLIIFRVLPINLGELASFASIQSCSHKSLIWVCVKLYSMGPSVIINTFIFYNCCFLHARTSSLPGPQGPASSTVSPPHTPPRPMGSVPALSAGLRPTICQMPAGSSVPQGGKESGPLPALCAAQRRHKWAGDLSNRVKTGPWPRDLKTSVVSLSKSAKWKDPCLHNMIVFTQRFNASIEQKLFS